MLLLVENQQKRHSEMMFDSMKQKMAKWSKLRGPELLGVTPRARSFSSCNHCTH